MGSTQEQLLRSQYVTPGEPGSYSGPEKLRRSIAEHTNVDIPISRVKRWMKGNDTYTKHRVSRAKFKRNPIIASHIDEQWQGDLAEVGNLARWNDRIRYLLVLIDVVSKYLWVEPLRAKSGPVVLAGFQRIWDRTMRRPEKLQTDDGTEFSYHGVQNMLRGMNIIFFTIKSDKKAAIAERVIRTLKDKIWRYMHENHTKRYIDVLQDLVESYNKTYHKSIKMAPTEVDENTEGQVLETLYGHLWKTVGTDEPKFKVGELVRISHLKQHFRKGYMGNWTEEVFRVRGMKRYSEPRIVYLLEDWSRQPIEGSFYPEELQSVEKDLQGYWKVERVIRSRMLADGSREHFVKWQGYPDSMNSWVHDNDMTRL
jgi:hypothetical protein